MSEIDLLIQELRDTIDNQRETIEQLESIRKKAIKKIDKNSFEKEEFGCWFRVFKTDLQGIAQDLLNILNKGE